MAHLRPLLGYLRSFQTILQNKNCTLRRILTQVVGIEGKHADHLTTTATVQTHKAIAFFHLPLQSLSMRVHLNSQFVHLATQ